MIEVKLRYAKIAIRGRQVAAPDGDDAVDISVPLGKAFQNCGECKSLTSLIVLDLPPGRLQRLYLLPGFAREPAIFSEPSVPQDIRVDRARAVKKLPL